MIVPERDYYTIEKVRLNGKAMRTSYASIFVTLIIVISISNVYAESKGVISNCINSNTDNMPESWTIEDQSCLRIDLGELDPNSIMSFNIETNQEIDIILFPANSLQVYLNEQSYRSDMIWQGESTFENFNGDGEWHWTVPEDRETTRWYLVIDNFNHPGDDDKGAQGGQEVEVTLDAQSITPVPFTLHDSVIRVGTGTQAIAYGPFVVDSGTYVKIFARTMEGNPDIFIMTEAQKDLYSNGGTAASRIIEADMLLVSSERFQPWLVPENYEGINLFVMVDNRAGPGGGGAGTTNAAITITLTLDPILNPIISTIDDQQAYNVGEMISFSALETPNRSNQVLESGYSWDINEDGIDDFFGPQLDYTWNNPDNISLKLSIISSGGIIASKIIPIMISDLSPPNVSISANGDIQKGYGQNLLISGIFSDNWDIDRTVWMVDGEIKQSNYSIIDSSSSFSFTFDSSYAVGEHLIEFIVTDKSGLSASDSVKLIISDITPPVFREYENTITQEMGTPINFQVIADDDESSEIQYTWIFNQGTINEIQLSGMLVTYNFDSSGAQRVVCIAENSVGLTSEAEIIVNILQINDEDKSLDPVFLLILIIIILFLVSLIMFKLIQRRIRLRAEELSNAEKEEPVIENLPPSIDEQKQMWGENSVMSPSQISVQGIEPLIADIDLDDLLAGSHQESFQKIDDFDDNLLNDLIDKKDTTSELKENSINRLIKKNCSVCGLLFSVQLPDGIDSARTACPKCGSIEDVSILL